MTDERPKASMDEWPKELDDEAREIAEDLLPLAEEALEAEEREILMHPAVQAAFADEETRRDIAAFEARLGGNR